MKKPPLALLTPDGERIMTAAAKGYRGLSPAEVSALLALRSSLLSLPEDCHDWHRRYRDALALVAGAEIPTAAVVAEALAGAPSCGAQGDIWRLLDARLAAPRPRARRPRRAAREDAANA